MSGKGKRLSLLTLLILLGVLTSSCATVAYGEVGSVSLRLPAAPGKATVTHADATVDYSNAADGYFAVTTHNTKDKMKLLVSVDGGEPYRYTLHPSDGPEYFPFSQGDGAYTLSVYRNIRDDSYALSAEASVEVKLTDPLTPFLYPNQYVNYGEDSEAVNLSVILAKGKKNGVAVAGAVLDYVTKNISYDRERAKTAASDYLPDVDAVLEEKKGICFDYAALTCAMLRAQDIPCRLVIGYAGEASHAWVSAYFRQTGWIRLVRYGANTWTRFDPTFSANAKGDASIQAFIGDGKNYTELSRH